jgi:hypothetical protein
MLVHCIIAIVVVRLSWITVPGDSSKKQYASKWIDNHWAIPQLLRLVELPIVLFQPRIICENRRIYKNMVGEEFTAAFSWWRCKAVTT